MQCPPITGGAPSRQAMGWWRQLLLGLWAVLPTWAGPELLNICMNAKPHKPEPSPEDKLYEEVRRADLVWRVGRVGAPADQGRATKAKMVSQSASTLTRLFPKLGFGQRPLEGGYDLLRPKFLSDPKFPSLIGSWGLVDANCNI